MKLTVASRRTISWSTWRLLRTSATGMSPRKWWRELVLVPVKAITLQNGTRWFLVILFDWSLLARMWEFVCKCYIYDFAYSFVDCCDSHWLTGMLFLFFFLKKNDQFEFHWLSSYCYWRVSSSLLFRSQMFSMVWLLEGFWCFICSCWYGGWNFVCRCYLLATGGSCCFHVCAMGGITI